MPPHGPRSRPGANAASYFAFIGIMVSNARLSHRHIASKPFVAFTTVMAREHGNVEDGWLVQEAQVNVSKSRRWLLLLGPQMFVIG